MKYAPFHLSLPCYDVEDTRQFYVDKLGFQSGRSTDAWIDIDMAGNQLTFLKALRWRFPDKYYQFEGQVLPAFHFGILLDQDRWEEQYAKCKSIGLNDEDPVLFLQDKHGEHRSFFVEDPNNYVIEFKCFTRPEEAFLK